MMRKHTFFTGVRSSESGVRSSEFLVLSSESGERRAETGKKSADGLLRKFGSTTGVAIVSAAALATLFFAGCGRKPEGGPPGMGGGGPLEVSVLTVKPTSVMLTQDLPGRISAFRVAEVRARVNGIVLRRLFSEGSDVKEGQLLYEIDPAPYQAAFDSARGALARAEANVTTARLKEERYKQLLIAKAISKQDYDDAVANAGAFDADVISGKAARRSSASRSMTLAPQPCSDCRVRMSRPICQYNSTNSRFTASVARCWAIWMRPFSSANQPA